MRADVPGTGELPGDILTPRLVLRPATLEILRADLEGRSALAGVLDARVPEDWPPDLYDPGAIGWAIRRLERDPVLHGWLTYYLMLTPAAEGTSVLIGAGGFKGPANEHGVVEIGYSIVQSERRHGYATESAQALLARAFSDARVQRVAAETLPDLVASIGVLEKIGMQLVGPGTEAVGKVAEDAGWREQGVIRFEIGRTQYEGSSSRLPA